MMEVEINQNVQLSFEKQMGNKNMVDQFSFKCKTMAKTVVFENLLFCFLQHEDFFHLVKQCFENL